jgi:hypothetical protein
MEQVVLRHDLLVNNPAPRAVDDAHSLFHLLDSCIVHQMLRVWGEWGVDRDEVRLGPNLIMQSKRSIT